MILYIENPKASTKTNKFGKVAGYKINQLYFYTLAMKY